MLRNVNNGSYKKHDEGAEEEGDNHDSNVDLPNTGPDMQHVGVFEVGEFVQIGSGECE